jgi:hypothetical protein
MINEFVYISFMHIEFCELFNSDEWSDRRTNSVQ